MKVRVSGHFGEWVQGRLGLDGPVLLLTIACRELGVTVKKRSAGPLQILSECRLFENDQYMQFLGAIGGATGTYEITHEMPLGGGAGASTATLVGLSRASGGDESRLVHACLDVEGATDPLMLPDPDQVLWASREGRVVHQIPTLPEAEIVGGFWGDGVATDPEDEGFEDIQDLVERLLIPVSLEELAEIATESASRCGRVRGPINDPTLELAEDLGALGCIRAHTGSARGLIFHPGEAPPDAEELLRRRGFERTLKFRTGGA